ncbi:MAG: hypothetical protein R3263_09880 [Myxococcota bacterium]|nr:hypothetical protein [Myxococcota bacterium]
MPSHDASLPASEAQRTEAGPDAVPWVASGLLGGALGAATVAVFFLIVDLVAGRPLWTPTTLGSALFRGEMLPASAPAEPVLVLGYTAVHGLVFVGFGLIAAFLLMNGERRIAGGRAVALAGALFAAFEITFVIFAIVFDRQLMQELGAGRVALANALAAVVMTVFLAARDATTRRTLGQG